MDRQGGGGAHRSHVDLEYAISLVEHEGSALGIGEVAGLLTDPNRQIQNVTEWAKKKSMGVRREQVQIPLSDEFLGRSSRTARRTAEKKDARAVQKIDDGIEAQMYVLKIPAPGLDSGDGGRGSQRRILSPKDLGILKDLTSGAGGLPAEHQKPASTGCDPTARGLWFQI